MLVAQCKLECRVSSTDLETVYPLEILTNLRNLWSEQQYQWGSIVPTKHQEFEEKLWKFTNSFVVSIPYQYLLIEQFGLLCRLYSLSVFGSLQTKLCFHAIVLIDFLVNEFIIFLNSRKPYSEKKAQSARAKNMLSVGTSRHNQDMTKVCFVLNSLVLSY